MSVYFIFQPFIWLLYRTFSDRPNPRVIMGYIKIVHNKSNEER